MSRILWILVNVILLYINWYIVYTFILNSPISEWWTFPSLLSLFICQVTAFCYLIDDML